MDRENHGFTGVLPAGMSVLNSWLEEAKDSLRETTITLQNVKKTSAEIDVKMEQFYQLQKK